jgi:PAS domain S-box-containing protein
MGKDLEELVVKRTEEIKTQAHWYESLLNALPFPLSVTDSEMKWTYINKATEDILNVKRKDVLGKPCSNWDTYICNTENCGIVRAKRGEMQTNFTQWERNFQVDTTILKNLSGDDTGFIEIVQDITQLEQQKVNLITAEEKARNATEAKSRFVANMSHEMRTPMNVVVGLTDLMLDDDVPDNVKEKLKKINTAGNALLGLINDVLDISKIEADKFELIPVQYDMPSLINDIINMNIIRVGYKPISFKLEINDQMPNYLYGDELRIKQIANNLLSNAFKYTEKGTITLGMTCECDKARSDGENDVWMSMFISDTGIGIRGDDMQKLFMDYNQVDTRANRKVEGTGLGLSITKKLVELM